MRKKFLGIDYGDKRIGLALAENNGPALPFKIILNDQTIIENLKDIIEQEHINLIVIGMPHSFSGQANERQKITKEFISHLKNVLNIKIDAVDEQLTSRLYEKMGVKKDIDKYAAAAILDTYLSQHDL